MALGRKELADRFGTRPAVPGSKREKIHSSLRSEFFELAEILDEVLPDGRHKGLAINSLQEASMWAQKAAAELPDDL